MKYSEAIQYMYDALPMYHRLGKIAYKKDLTNIRLLCDALDNPQTAFKAIHIAGTNGKGSVSNMLAAVLQENGYRTGLYVSPHYKDFRERIKINGDPIAKRAVSKFIKKHSKLFEEVKPSFFEMTVAMAFFWFSQENVDIAVIETGLGGRLDSTNIIFPLLSIITNISWDHSDILGDTLEKIAAEKAGIIKEGIPVLIGRRQIETTEIFKAVSKARHSQLYFAESMVIPYEVSLMNLGINKIKALVLGQERTFIPSLKGNYQAENIRTVIAACELLENKLPQSLSGDKIVKALENTTELTHMLGRWHVLENKPLVICESAHNEDGIRYLALHLSTMCYSNLHIVCGFVKDKPLEKLLSILPKSAKYYFVNADMPRALNSSSLKDLAGKIGLDGKSYGKVKHGFVAAKEAAKENDVIIVTGSIFVIGEIM